ncbi:hypothetical protein MKX03_037690 [Papaver bracteatum]|nr:hypothetical protein MKX03_037690 [Papaver bracteatum]
MHSVPYCTADKKPLPEKLGSVLKESLVVASQDFLGEAKKLYRGRGKNGFGCMFDRIKWLNLRDLSKKLVKDKRVLNGDYELLLESIVKTKYNIPNELRSKRWESTLSLKQIFYATYEAYRAYQLGNKLLSASGVGN